MYDQKGNIVPVTLVEAGPCYVTQIKKEDKDKYESVQIGFEKKKDKKIRKSEKIKPYKTLKEFKKDVDLSKYNVGDEINVSIFGEGDIVKVSGVSKGKGFQGGVKRWGWGGKPHHHGMKHEERAMGSAGPGFPQRVIPGRKMPGHMGFERTTVRNLKIAKVDKENNLLAIKGAVPGRRGTLLEIRG